MHFMLERAPDTSEQPYVLQIEQLDNTLMADSRLSIPIHYERSRDTYNVELAGFRVDAPHPNLLPALAKPLLEGLINLARLPSYVFVARRSRAIYPVYTVGDDVIATTPGGPVFRHVELAKVRQHLSDYLHLTGVLGQPGLSDKLHVRGVDPQTLELIRPVFYLKKRIPQQTDFWSPVFAGPDTIYTFAASARREVPRNAGLEILELQQVVAQALIADRRLHSSYDLRPDRLMAEHWLQLEQHCKREPHQLQTGEHTLALYRYADTLIGVEQRPESLSTRPGLFLHSTLAELEASVQLDFERRGMLIAL